MNETHTLTQRRGKETYHVELGAAEVKYRSRGPRGEGSATIPFELLSRRTTSFRRSNPFLRNAAIYFAVLTVVTAGFGFLVDLNATVAALWAALAAGCYVTFRLTGVEYEIFPLADRGAFGLLVNGPSATEYGTFKDELFERRDAYLLSRYAPINVERPARLERRRIDWLRDEGVITDDAYTTIVETIEEHATRN